MQEEHVPQEPVHPQSKQEAVEGTSSGLVSEPGFRPASSSAATLKASPGRMPSSEEALLLEMQRVDMMQRLHNEPDAGEIDTISIDALQDLDEKKRMFLDFKRYCMKDTDIPPSLHMRRSKKISIADRVNGSWAVDDMYDYATLDEAKRYDPALLEMIKQATTNVEQRFNSQRVMELPNGIMDEIARQRQAPTTVVQGGYPAIVSWFQRYKAGTREMKPTAMTAEDYRRLLKQRAKEQETEAVLIPSRLEAPPSPIQKRVTIRFKPGYHPPRVSVKKQKRSFTGTTPSPTVKRRAKPGFGSHSEVILPHGTEYIDDAMEPVDAQMPPQGTDFTPVPLPKTRRSDLAVHQPVYSFRSIMEAEPSEDGEERVESGMPPVVSEGPQSCFPINYQSELFLMPRDPTSVANQGAADGFDEPPPSFTSWTIDFSSYSSFGDSSALADANEPNHVVRSFGGRIKNEEARKKCWAIAMKKEGPKEARKLAARLNATTGHYKRVSSMVAREVKRRALRGFRSAKETNLRARRLMRDVLSYWRKHEKDVVERKKKAEKELADKRKREEDLREQRRQQKKLDFLLTQTELFSHFIGAKMGIIQQPESPSAAAAPAEDQMELDGEEFESPEQVKAKAVEKTQQLLAEHQQSVTSHKEAYKKLSDNQSVEQDASGQLDQMDLLNPSTMPQMELHTEPSLFKGKLKSYQLKGLNWLANLFEQGINGILADEMGLGKTIQSISFMAHLAEAEDIWGPFLIVAPNSTLIQWINEINRFCPALKVIPYWGNERKVIRKYWNPKELYKKDASFHVCVTSYKTFVNDEKYFQRLNWQYLILDEAQAIKNASTQRWNALLNIRCRNRLLLTGTPIQNSMAELWSLLHFIMPSLFDSHDEFNEWFSKDVEGGDKEKLSAHQIQRLHVILKPFMLRRVKKDVMNEMAPKIEIQLNCPLSRRQRVMYRAIKNKVPMQDLLASMDSTESLMNLVMQFRKVCNHPEIFERSSAVSPFVFSRSPRDVVHHSRKSRNEDQVENVMSRFRSPIDFYLPRLLEDATCIGSDNDLDARDKALQSTCSLWHTDTIESSSAMQFRHLIDLSSEEVSYMFWSQQAPLDHFLADMQYCNRTADALAAPFPCSDTGRVTGRKRMLVISEHMVPKKHGIIIPKRSGNAMLEDHEMVIKSVKVYCPRAIAAPVQMGIHQMHGTERRDIQCSGGWDKSLLYGFDCRSLASVGAALPSILPGKPVPHKLACNLEAFSSLEEMQVVPGMAQRLMRVQGSNSSMIQVPGIGKLIADSGKMLALDALLTKLKREGHRVLIFSQMRKMIDILEDFMHFRGHKVFRLDGNTDVFTRRSMVNDFQESDETFAFLLSTRAGGLGITLTAADTVIFYDSDWNPAMDAQAMDRVHRIGQTKQVRVYRLICKSTVEENILHRAQHKHKIQTRVYAGGFKLQQDNDLFQKNELKDMLLEDEQDLED